MWSHFELMDSPLYNLEGADSGLPFISDVQMAKNANDNQWMPTRFAKPGSAPLDQDGITDMSFVLVRLHLLRAEQSVVRRRNDASPEELSRIVDQTENFVKAKFIIHVDDVSPVHAIIVSYFNASIKSMRLLIEGVVARNTDSQDLEFRERQVHHCLHRTRPGMLTMLDSTRFVSRFSRNWSAAKLLLHRTTGGGSTSGQRHPTRFPMF